MNGHAKVSAVMMMTTLISHQEKGDNHEETASE
jgi:hypothetical protein